MLIVLFTHGYRVVPHYDSMLAKLIVYGSDRQEALAKMRSALGEFVIKGIRTNIPFHQKVMNHTDFIEAKHSTVLEEAGFLGKK